MKFLSIIQKLEITIGSLARKLFTTFMEQKKNMKKNNLLN
jgi:hypothetical protein